MVKGVSRLPWPFIYGLASLAFFFLFHLRLYRWKIVNDNLRRAFPEWGPAQLRLHTRAFYRGFCDLFAEILKAVTISEADLRKRVSLENPDLVQEMFLQQKGVILWTHHVGNFEWFNLRLSMETPPGVQAVAVYAPQTDGFSEWVVHKYRKRFGLKLIKATRRPVEILRSLKPGHTLGFLTDQRPKHQNSYYFTSFFGQPTAFTTTVGKLTLHYQAPLYFAEMRRVRRGHYSIALRQVPYTTWPEAEQTAQHLTDWYAQALEALIRHDPGTWLWSHKRWKQKPGPADTFSQTLEAPLSVSATSRTD